MNVAGLWAKRVGHMAGVDLPVTPMEHHYLITDTVEGLKNMPGLLSFVVDLDGFTYPRQEGDGLLMGVCERNHQHWNIDGAPFVYGMDLFPENLDRIGDELSIGFQRFPEPANVGIIRWVTGAFTFAPDGNPLVGPAGSRGYWGVGAVMAGLCQGGGISKSLAEWMINGASEADIFGMDVARFGEHQSNRDYIRQTTGQFCSRRFVMTCPNQQLPAGRGMGTSWGLEVPLFFVPRPDLVEPGTRRRAESFPMTGAECHAVKTAAGQLDITGFSCFQITGAGAAAWLDSLPACALPAPGRIKPAPMPLPVSRPAGPARAVLENTADTDLSGLTMMRCQHADLGLLRVHIARLSLSGELSYKINCLPSKHAPLRAALLHSGAGLGLKEIGFSAMLAPRLEIDAHNADCAGYEPVWQGGRIVGLTPSGGYGHRLQRSLALALVDRDRTKVGTDLDVHIVGEMRAAKVIAMSPYDPGGDRMRM